jgi:L-arabinonolactonase
VQPERLDLALAQGATLGEGLQWHAASGRWWWTDIEARRIHAWTPGAGATLSCLLPDRVGSFAHTRSGGLLLALAKRLVLARLPDAQACGEITLATQDLAPVEPALAQTRCNDGRCDRAGNFVFGTLSEASPREPVGSFYQYSTRHGLRRLALPCVAIANSICFSPDGARMYYCDTTSRAIMQCDYDAARAEVANPRLFARVARPHGWPDGAVTDAEGCLWNAQWGGACVARYAQDGQLLGYVELPAPHPSCPALGGPQGDWLMVTTAREALAPAELLAHPLSGSLFGGRCAAGLYLAETLFDDRP